MLYIVLSLVLEFLREAAESSDYSASRMRNVTKHRFLEEFREDISSHEKHFKTSTAASERYLQDFKRRKDK